MGGTPESKSPAVIGETSFRRFIGRKLAKNGSADSRMITASAFLFKESSSHARVVAGLHKAVAGLPTEPPVRSKVSRGTVGRPAATEFESLTPNPAAAEIPRVPPPTPSSSATTDTANSRAAAAT
jgi:hypothetical protein